MFWDYSDTSGCKFFGKLTDVNTIDLKYPFRTTEATGMFRNFYLTPVRVEVGKIELDPFRLYTKKDVLESKDE